MASGPNVCGALYNAKCTLREGTKAYNSVENALGLLQSRLKKFGKGSFCWEPGCIK